MGLWNNFKTLFQARPSQPKSQDGGFTALEDVDRLDEKLRSDPASIRFPLFLPFYDAQQSAWETESMRQAYRKMLNSAIVKAALYNQILSVAATELNFNPYRKRGEKQAKKRDREIADFTAWTFTERLQEGIPGMAWDIFSGGLIDGFSINEKVWAVHDQGEWKDKTILKRLKAKDPNQDCVLVIDEFRNIVAVRGLRYNAGKEFPPEDFLIYSHLGLFENPTGMSAFRAIYADYWLLDTVKKLRGAGAEKRAFPVITGEYPDAAKQPALEAALAKVKSSNWLAVPRDVKLQALNIAGSSEDYFKSFCADLTESIMIGIQGATLQAMSGKEGSVRGDSTVHKDTADLWKWHLSAMLLHLLNNYDTGLIREIVDLNYANVAGYPRASAGGVDDAELKESLAIDEGLQRLGAKLSRSATMERYGREEAQDESDLLAQPQPAAMPGQEGEPGTGTDPKAEPPAGPGGDSPPGAGAPDEPQADLPDHHLSGEAFAETKAATPIERQLAPAALQGQQSLEAITRQAVQRALAGGPAKALQAKRLFSPEEQAALAGILASATATADLAGRESVRQQLPNVDWFAEWDELKHPRDKGRFAAKAHAHLAAVGQHAMNGLTTAVHAAGTVEHAVTEAVKNNFERLPAALRHPVAGVVKVSLGTYIAAHHAVHAVARERGGKKHADRVARITAAADLVLAKGVPVAAEFAHLGAAAGLAASLVPWASLGYLAYATATNPLATLRAAREAISTVLTPVKFGEEQQINDLLDRLEDMPEEQADFFEALVCAALDKVRDLPKAVQMAASVLAEEQGHELFDEGFERQHPRGHEGNPGQFTNKGKGKDKQRLTQEAVGAHVQRIRKIVADVKDKLPEGKELSQGFAAIHAQTDEQLAGHLAKWTIRPGFVPLIKNAEGEYVHAHGEPLEPELAARAKEIKAMPGWLAVQFNSDPDGEKLAIGLDTKGRDQAIYTAAKADKSKVEKFLRNQALAQALPKIEERLRADAAAGKEEAAVLLLMQKMGFRVGGEGDTKTEHEAIGAANLRPEHITIDGDKVAFDFVGKKGVTIHQETTDKEVADLIKLRMKKERIFDTNDNKVRSYFAKVDERFVPKDLRTRFAAEQAMAKIARMKPPQDAKELESHKMEVAAYVAARLGNTPSVAQASYIPQEVYQAWEDGIKSAELPKTDSEK